MYTTSICAGCLNTDVKMHDLISSGLLYPYQKLTGLQDNFNLEILSKLCWECAGLVNKFNTFRLKCERARTLLQDIYNNYGIITKDSIQSIDRTEFKLTSSYTICGIENYNYKCSENEIFNREGFIEVKENFDTFPHYCDTKLDSDSLVNSVEDENFVEVEVRVKDELFDESILELGTEKCISDTDSDMEDLLTISKNAIKKENDVRIKKKVKAKLKSKSKKVSAKKGKLKQTVRKELEEEKDEDILEIATVLTLTQEEQMEEVRKRKDSKNYTEGLYKCDFCYKGFVHDEAYSSHMRRHQLDAGEFECVICRVRWETERKLKRHMQAAHSTKYLCKLCPVISRNWMQAKIHYKWHTGVIYKCDICGEEFKKKASYNSHCRMKHPCEDVCVSCGNSFVSKLGLKQHISQQHQNREPTIDPEAFCEECNIHFASPRALDKHMEVSPKHKAGEKKSRKVCRDCDLKFASFDEMHKHRREQHPNKKYRVYKPRKRVPAAKKPIKKEESKPSDPNLECKVCDRSFASKQAWVKHILKTPKHKDDAYLCGHACKVCGDTFADEESLTTHRRRMHRRGHSVNQNEPFACEQCGELMYSYQAYNIHFRRQHPNKTRTHYPAMKDPVMCEVCGKVFKCQALLKIHNYRHTGERPYKCAVCNKSYNSPTVLHFHKLIHADKTPFKCEICGQGFSKYSNLYRHRSVHTDATPYSCDMCGKRFKYKSTAKQHVEYVHMKKPWPKRDRTKRIAQDTIKQQYDT